ncbi:MAG: 1-(5-phosphoribosyl)-5-[(5-phosphoribosylamino)methylideneamino]imidazole-4-carboxamide isomerase [Campylobacterales bacterium]|nr:1-(5-phosphoribosyl)-5-[(5-phosphoribosylamino)methylideneamino]imidazole-4-carboxamide isomerase [Campylobacterales bacterium]
MHILPAIDLKDGQAVRLTKGLMESAKIYSNEPYELAKIFEDLGAKWLHIVDLNGAFAGEPKNLTQIEKIRANCNMKIEIGGGIRDEISIKRYIDLGIDRIILGSIAAKNANFVKEMAKKYTIAVGIDAINGFVAVEGWAEVSNLKASQLAYEYANVGVNAIICTDISKDGTLSGVNVEFTKEIAIASKIDTIASGGVKDIDDIKKLIDCGDIAGVIIGKAFYEGTIDLKSAFKLIYK